VEGEVQGCRGREGGLEFGSKLGSRELLEADSQSTHSLCDGPRRSLLAVDPAPLLPGQESPKQVQVSGDSALLSPVQGSPKEFGSKLPSRSRVVPHFFPQSKGLLSRTRSQ
jgi:hypothetical protein